MSRELTRNSMGVINQPVHGDGGKTARITRLMADDTGQIKEKANGHDTRIRDRETNSSAKTGPCITLLF